MISNYGVVQTGYRKSQYIRLKELLRQHEIVITPGAYDVVSAQFLEKIGFPVA
jgi:2-methylisocitrate lyase-like PEP mutase family enzyme